MYDNCANGIPIDIDVPILRPEFERMYPHLSHIISDRAVFVWKSFVFDKLGPNNIPFYKWMNFLNES